ncbi:MAG: ferritin-like domain-containing protein [Myxococcales bacterium]|nr:ferritin-like domain-containing protein [Myxococcales bacterium]
MPVVPLLARLTAPLAWRSPRRNVERLLLFARAERNTLVELEQAANGTGDPARAAAYLVHAADEGRHAAMFVARARRIAEAAGLPAPASPHTDTAWLFATLGEPRFLAFVHHGEGRGRRQFEGYRDRLDDPATSAMFAAIVEDELRHETYAGELLAVASDAPAREVRAARLWEAWRTLRTVQRGLAGRMFALAVLLLVPLLLPLAAFTRRVRPTSTGWT